MKRAEHFKNITINEASIDYFDKIKPTLKPSERGYLNWLSPLRTHVFPKYGALRVSDVNSGLLVEIFSPIWHTKPALSNKLFARVRKILRANGTPISVFEDAKLKLPVRAPALQRHFKSMDWRKVPEFYGEVSDFPATPARLCLQLVILTAVRCAEARRAEHGHFSFETATWTVPAELVKGPLGATVPHLVPMNDAVVSVVKTAMEWHPKWLFPSPSQKLCISDVAMTRIIKGMGYEETVHGFRSSFRDWAAENGEEFESAEAQLHHTIGNKVTRAYYRTNLLERRRAMMGRWASFVIGIEIDSNVSKFRSRL